MNEEQGEQAIEAALRRAMDEKTKPLGALGRLEELAVAVGRIQGTTRPRVTGPRLAIFAGDHGAEGVSAYPREVTAQMVRNFLSGGAAASVLARRVGLELTVVDAGVDAELPSHLWLVDAKVARGTRSFLEGKAMTRAEACEAVARGRVLAAQWAEAGTNVLALGEMGIGNTSSASLVSACLLGDSLDGLVGRGAGLDDAGLARKHALLEAALARGGRPEDPYEVLAEYGGFEIAMLAGAILGAASRRVVVILDGFIVTAAALVARALEPRALESCVFSHLSDEPGHRKQCEALGARPLLELGLRLGEGSGAALAFSLVQASVDLLNEMATFSSASVSEAG